MNRFDGNGIDVYLDHKVDLNTYRFDEDAVQEAHAAEHEAMLALGLGPDGQLVPVPLYQ